MVNVRPGRYCRYNLAIEARTGNTEDQATNHVTLSKKKTKRLEGVHELRRPILFLCNDLYAKALRPLRDLAINVKIESADPQRLKQSLRSICREENLKVDDDIIEDICAESNYDARAAVNALQFMGMICKDSERVTRKELHNKTETGV